MKNILNDETIAAIKDLEDIKNTPDKCKKYSFFSDLRKEMEEEINAEFNS